MKKFYLGAAFVAVIGLSSCSTISHTAYTQAVDTQLYNRSVADLDVSDQIITYTYYCDYAHSKAGEKSVKAAAIQKALEVNGGGDVIVNPQYEVKKTRRLFSSKINYVTVTGHPAKYKNVHPMTEKEAEIITTLKKK